MNRVLKQTLSLGVRPTQEQYKWALNNKSDDDFAEKILDRFDLVQRANAMSVLSDPVSPRTFVDWLVQKGLSVPEALRPMVEERSEIDWKQKYEEERAAHYEAQLQLCERELELKRIDKPTYDMALKILAVLAIKKWRFEPEMQRNAATKAIFTALEGYGVNL